MKEFGGPKRVVSSRYKPEANQMIRLKTSKLDPTSHGGTNWDEPSRLEQKKEPGLYPF